MASEIYRQETIHVSHLANSALSSRGEEVALPSKIDDLAHSLFRLHRQLERLYLPLSWPSKMKNIVVFTEIVGGKGDIAASAKAIALMHEMYPELSFDWVLRGSYVFDRYNPRSFLTGGNVKCIRTWLEGIDQEPADFMLTGPIPVRSAQEFEYVQSKMRREIRGPTVNFAEIAEKLPGSFCKRIAEQSLKTVQEAEFAYPTLHSVLFPSNMAESEEVIPMGLKLGSGVFLSRDRIEAPRSFRSCCPKYLLQIEDSSLRKDILEAMDVPDDGAAVPDYEKHSFYAGYAHHPISWAKFIDCVALHDHKQVVIVLNQKGEFQELSTKGFFEGIFTEDRLNFLQKKGYGSVVVKGIEAEPISWGHPESGRRITVIVRPHFSPPDMRCTQLAAKGLIATGDNTAVESWCARCELFLYEDVNNSMSGCKRRFLQQQIDIANEISPHLGRILALFSGDLKDVFNDVKPLTTEEMDEMEKLLSDPNLPEYTMKFCELITSKFSFNDVLEGAMKRAAWHHQMPALLQLEAEGMGEEFCKGMIAYLKDPDRSSANLPVQELDDLGKRIQEAVAK